LSQVVNVQLNNMGDGGGSSNAPSSQQPGAPDSGGDNNDQERTRYRLWLSTMVESLTSFFSQHGINSSDSVDVTPAPTPQPPTATTTTSVAGSSQARQFPGIPPRPGTSAVPQCCHTTPVTGRKRTRTNVRRLNRCIFQRVHRLPSNGHETHGTNRKKRDETRHNGCQTTRLNTQSYDPERRSRRGLPTIQATHTEITQTI
jgi:hypothetical protein